MGTGGKGSNKIVEATLKAVGPFRSLKGKHVAFLVSIADKKVLGKENFQASIDFLIKNDVREVTIVVGGFLKRWLFWRHPSYKQDGSIPSEEVMCAQAKKWEDEWIKENIEGVEALVQQNKDLKFNIIKWQDFLNCPNYSTSKNRVMASSTYQEALETTVQGYLKRVRKDDSSVVKGEHLDQARTNARMYFREESPLFDRAVLDCDYLMYPGGLTAVFKAAYKFFNQDEVQERWLEVVYKSRKIHETTGYIPGHSSIREKITDSPLLPQDSKEIDERRVLEEHTKPILKVFEKAKKRKEISEIVASAAAGSYPCSPAVSYSRSKKSLRPMVGSSSMVRSNSEPTLGITTSQQQHQPILDATATASQPQEWKGILADIAVFMAQAQNSRDRQFLDQGVRMISGIKKTLEKKCARSAPPSPPNRAEPLDPQMVSIPERSKLMQ